MKNKVVGNKIFYKVGKEDIGLFVSPKNPEFNENLEKGIRDLVILLNDRHYPTISSCQGHNFSLNRRVSICFPNKEKMEKFECLIKSFNIPYLVMYEHKVEDFYNLDKTKNFKAGEQIANELSLDWEPEFVGDLNFEHNSDHDINKFASAIKKTYRQFFYLEEDYQKLLNLLHLKLLPLYFL